MARSIAGKLPRCWGIGETDPRLTKDQNLTRPKKPTSFSSPPGYGCFSRPRAEVCLRFDAQLFAPCREDRGDAEKSGPGDNAEWEPPSRQSAAENCASPRANAAAGHGRRPIQFPSTAASHWA